MKRSPQALGRGILFCVAMVIVAYEMAIDPHPPGPDPTILIAALGIAAASISLKWDGRS